MKPIQILIAQQWQDWKRSKLLVIMTGLIIFLWIFCIVNGVSFYKSTVAQQTTAQQQSRDKWLMQDNKHPHMAAHYGNFAFKPTSVLSIFDNGINAYAGNFIYLEAHKQNDFLFSQAQSASSIIRLGVFDVSLLLQLVFSLFIIVLTFNSITGEKTKGTFQLLQSAGITNKQLLWSKIFAVFTFVGCLLISLIGITIPILLFFKIQFVPADFLKLLIFTVGYLCFFFILSALGVLVSAKSKALQQSFIVLLSFWIIAAIVLPKVVNTIAANAFKLPSNTDFKAAVKKDIMNGIDGHNTNDARAEKIINDLLKKYGVDSTHKLPVNVEGVVMMEGEKYSSQVYNMHFDSLRNILEKQQHFLGYTSYINLFMAIKLLSMGVCNSDMYNEIEFRKAAEAYRMQFVQAMNNDMAQNSKESEFQTYKISSKDFEKIPAFNFTTIGARKISRNYLFEIMAIVFVVLSLFIFINVTANKQQTT